MHYEFGGLIHGGAYFRNFTVIPKWIGSVKKYEYNVTAKSWLAVSTTGAFRLKSGKSLLNLCFFFFNVSVGC